MRGINERNGRNIFNALMNLTKALSLLLAFATNYLISFI
jgi:hypothetical protein